MKKALLGTSALIAAAMIASPAAAQLEISFDAGYDVEVGWTDNDSVPGGDDWDFQNEGFITLDATAVDDNGLDYGFTLDLDNIRTGGGGVDVDETFFRVTGSFGTVFLGDNDHAADQIRVGVPTAGTGIFDGGFGDYVGGGFGGARQDIVSIGPAGNTDATKITYVSTGADLAGFTVGVSYSPDSGSQGANLSRVNGPPAGAYENIFSAGARYEGDFQGFGITAGAAGYLGDNAAPAAGADNDLQSWTVGAIVETGGFEVGVNYVDSEGIFNPLGVATGVNGSPNGFNVGVTYAVAGWEVGATYSDFEDDDNNSDEQVYGVGASYDWLPGVGIDADVVAFEGSGNNDDGWVALLRLDVDV